MRAWILLAALWLGACTGAVHPAAGLPPMAGAVVQAPAIQLLVMLRIPSPHYQPAQDYAGSYQASPGREARRRIARQLAREHGLILLDDWPMPTLKVDCFVMQAARGASLASLSRDLAADPRVDSVEPVHTFHVLGALGDPLYPLQPAAAIWHLGELHALATGRRLLIAEVDSGVDLAQPDLAGQVAEARNFVDDGAYRAEAHGTAVAGIIAAREGNGLGIAGIAPEARLLALRACRQPRPDDAAAECTSFALAKALQYALESRAKIINLSLGGPRDRLLGRLLAAAQERGISVVGAWDDVYPDGGFPADLPGVLAVAGEQDLAAGARVLRAPATDIPAPLPGSGFGFVSGASFAAAQVSGLVALLRELSPDLDSWRQVRDALAAPPALGLIAQRPGTIDACAAVASAIARCACGCRSAGVSFAEPHR